MKLPCVLNGKSERGLTLIELLIVIVIIGVLASIAVPLYHHQQARAAEATVKSDLKNMATYIQEYIVKHDGRFPSALPSESFSKWSKNNTLSLSDDGTCVQGVNSIHPSATWYYDAAKNVMTKEPWCAISDVASGEDEVEPLPEPPSSPPPSPGNPNPVDPPNAGGSVSTLVNAALFVGNRVAFTNQWRLHGDSGDLYVDGDFECNSQVIMDADVIVTGEAYLTNNCVIDGDVWAVDGVRMDSTPRVSGSVNTPGNVSFHSTAFIGGNVNLGGEFSSMDGRTVDQLKSSGRIGGNVNEGWEVNIPASEQFPQISYPENDEDFITWGNWLKLQASQNPSTPSWAEASLGESCSITAGQSWSLDGDIEVREPTTIDARKVTNGCDAVSFEGNSRVILYDDLTIYTDGFKTPNGVRFESGDGGSYNLQIISPSVSGAPACTSARNITLGAQSKFDSRISTLIYTDSKFEVNTGTEITGQVVAGCVAGSGEVDLYYKPVSMG